MVAAIQIITTTETEADAAQIAQALVDKRLAACVQISGPIRSTYHWQGRVETSQEWKCVIKSVDTLYSAVEETIRALHSYDVPEIMASPVSHCSEPYLSWMCDQLANND